MEDLFKLRKIRWSGQEAYKINLDILRPNQVMYGTKSFRTYVQNIRKTSPLNIKSSQNPQVFHKIIKNKYLVFIVIVFYAQNRKNFFI